MVEEWPNFAKNIIKLAQTKGKKLTEEEEVLIAQGKEEIVGFFCLFKILGAVYRKRKTSDKTFGTNVRTCLQSFITCAKVCLF